VSSPPPTVSEIVEGVSQGRWSAGHWPQVALERIATDDSCHAFLHAEDPRAESADPAGRAAANAGAESATDDAPESAAGSARPLAGVPVAVKDNIATLELPTTCASRLLDGYVSPFEATVVERLRAAGARVVGKTNMDEFGMGSSTENSAYGPTLNPVDADRVPGGSSGGSAAAVASGLCPVALGSDTGGSVRQPASLCGVVGFKPTYGRVSRYGLVAFASSLDQVGVLGTCVDDAARVLEVIAGPDDRDSTCGTHPVPDLGPAGAAGVEGLTIGVPVEYFPESLDPRIETLCRAALDRLQAAGATLRPVSLPHTHLAIPTYYVLATAEASSNLSRFDGVRFGRRADGADSLIGMYDLTRERGFGAEVKRRILLGTYALSAGYYDAYYGRAQRVRRLIAGDFARAFAEVDALFTPTSPSVAFRLGERLASPVDMYLSDVFTVTANLAGIPALSLPIGHVDGLPVGGQVLAPRWREDTVVRVAGALEGLMEKAP
jgi:aspartyl-tRNA(Asn)/glutamyl-tRNA(Gln) amidotransferase subunit A